MEIVYVIFMVVVIFLLYSIDDGIMKLRNEITAACAWQPEIHKRLELIAKHTEKPADD